MKTKNLLFALFLLITLTSSAQLPDLKFDSSGSTVASVNNNILTIQVDFANFGNVTSPATEAMAYLSNEDEDDLDYLDPYHFCYFSCFNVSPVAVPPLAPGQSYTVSFVIDLCEFQQVLNFFSYDHFGCVIDFEDNIAELDNSFADNSAFAQNGMSFNPSFCNCATYDQCVCGFPFCETNIDYVCGCDNVTYDNGCFAELAGVYDYSPGECGCEDGDIDCNETITVSTLNSGNNVNWQDNQCVSSGYNANDRIIRFERSSSYVTNWITLWNYNFDDIDLFVFEDDCPGGLNNKSKSCIASSTNPVGPCGSLNYESIELSGLPAGTYYILIDGKQTNDENGTIYLSVSCESLDCSDYMEIECDDPITSSNTNRNNRSSHYYSCYNPGNGCYDFSGSWTAGEKIFKFTAPEDGFYDFCMDPIGNIDLELFLFDYCCDTEYDPNVDLEVITEFDCFDNCAKAATAPSGEPETISQYYMEEGQMVWLIIDGFLGDEGSFTLEVKCNNFDCDDIDQVFPVSCAQKFDDSNDPSSSVAANTNTVDILDVHNLCNNTTDGCKDVSPASGNRFENPEVIYYFDGRDTDGKDVVFDIFPREANLDVDLFVYEVCYPEGLDNCVRSSTFPVAQNDAVLIEDVASNAEYYVVVDGQSNLQGLNSIGRYRFSVTCGKLSDHTAIPLECGATVNGSTFNGNNYASYYCNCPEDEDEDRSGGGNNGNEVVYTFSISGTSDIQIRLEDFGNADLELYLLDEMQINNCLNTSRNTQGQDESIERTLQAGTYYIVVEGYDEDAADFQLTLEGCNDICQSKNTIRCEDFEAYNFNQRISSQSNAWTGDFLGLGELDCKVQINNTNQRLLVERENNINCASAMILEPTPANSVVELSLDLIMPYYNLGNFPLMADGAEIYIFEEDVNSQDEIYLAFRPHSLDPNNDDRRVCLQINDAYMSDGCANGDGELFPFMRGATNKLRVRLNKVTEQVSVYINDDLLASANNTGISNLGMIGFRSVFNANGGFIVDNICLEECTDCSSCPDPCDESSDLSCIFFENYTPGVQVSAQASGWQGGYFSASDTDCSVMQDGGNRFLWVERDNNTDCSSARELDYAPGSEVIELSFSIEMPYINPATAIRNADGAEIWIYENDSNSQDLIYLAFRDHSSDVSSDDRNINLQITDKYFSPNDNELFPFNRDASNRVSIRLNKQTEKVSIFINDTHVRTVQNSGMSDMSLVGFRSTFNDRNGFRVDDICTSTCIDCPQVYYVDEGAAPAYCASIVVNNVSPVDQGTIFEFGIDSELEGEFLKWELTDMDTGEVIEESTTDATSYNSCCMIPGRNYYVCYWYYDQFGCLRYCCITVCLPIDCSYFYPRYSGGENQPSYDLVFDDQDSDAQLIGWFSDDTDSSLGDQLITEYIPGAFGQRYICCLVYLPSSGKYILCCRSVCVDNPFDCSQINCTGGGSMPYTFTCPTEFDDVSWYLDFPVAETLDEGNSISFSPEDYGIGPYECFIVSYRYRDAFGCWKFCCKKITPEIPENQLVFNIGESCGPEGSLVTIPVTATNFNNISTFSASLNIENNFASFVEINPVALPASLVSNIINNQTAVLTWLSSTGQAIDLPDQSVLFNLIVRIEGNGRQEAVIRFSNDPTPLTVINGNQQEVEVVTVSGSACLSDRVTLSGRIAKPDDSPVQDVEVNLTGHLTDQDYTNGQGNYSFDLDGGYDYTVTPLRDGDDRNGVDVLDQLLLQRHLLFIDRFDSPYAWVAADMNDDNKVDVLDLLLLQRLILFISPEIEDLNAWRFIDSKYAFPGNPLAADFPESIEYNPLNNDVSDADFVAVKIGDLNNSSTSAKQQGKPRYKLDCNHLLIPEMDVTTGQTVQLAFTANDFTELLALSAEVNFDTEYLSYTGFESSELPGFSEGNVSAALASEGYALVSWISNTGLAVQINSEQTVFELSFDVLQDGRLSDILSLSNDNLNSEIIDAALESNCLDMMFDQSSSSHETTLFRQLDVFPNPFSDNINVEISGWNTSKSVRLNVMDVNGKVLHHSIHDLNKGMMKVRLEASQWTSTPGIYIISVASPEAQIFRKIVYIE